MSEVIYSINGHYFKDYGVYVSDSQGIMDALVRKPTKSYNWHEYHGESVDLNKPKFEAREISLSCFIDGENYEQMFLSFQNFIIEEFQKSGTQRLMIEPFGYKPLVYEVYMKEGVKLDKTFKDGRMVGIFDIKLIEPNPIKKVLYTTSDTLNLSYNSSKETEIFFVNGEKTNARGNVSLSGKTLANRDVSGYNFNGRNLILNSNVDITGIGLLKVFNLSESLVVGEVYTASMKGTASDGKFNLWGNLNAHSVLNLPSGTSGVVSVVFTVPNWTNLTQVSVYNEQTANPSTLNWIKIEKGNKATDWSPAPEDERYIIIAGDVDGITNLNTNATVLWEKL